MNTEQEIQLILTENALLDVFKKNTLSKRQKAHLIKKYAEIKNMSLRAVAREFGISHSTLLDWTLWDKVTEEEYQNLVKQGYSESEIYKYLRNGEFSKLAEKSRTHKLLEEATNIVKKFLNDFDNDVELLPKVDELQNYLNRFKSHLKRSLQKSGFGSK